MTRTVTVEVGDCHVCGKETSIRIYLRRRNVTHWGDQVVDRIWCCEHHRDRLVCGPGGIYEQTDV